MSILLAVSYKNTTARRRLPGIVPSSVNLQQPGPAGPIGLDVVDPLFELDKRASDGGAGVRRGREADFPALVMQLCAEPTVCFQIIRTLETMHD